MKRSFWWLVSTLVILLIGFYLAVTRYASQIVFGYDQARDAFEAYSIWRDFNLKILGPSTDIPGVFHGALWYYFLAVVYFFGGDISSATFLVVIILFLSFIPVATLAHKLFGNVYVTCLTLILLAISPLFQVFTRWLSNPSLALLVTPINLIFLWQYIQKPSLKLAFFSGLFLGLLVQTNFAYLVMLLVIPIYYFTFRFKWKIWDLVFFVLGLSLALSSFIVAEWKFDWQGVCAILDFLRRSGLDSSKEFSDVTLTLLNRIFNIFSLTIFPWPKLATAILLLTMFYKLLTSRVKIENQPIKFLLVWINGFIFMQILSSAVSGSAHILAAFIAPVIILFAYFIFKSGFLWLIPLILLAQLLTLLRWESWQYSPLSVQRGMFFSVGKEIVDYTYQKANGKPFIINAVTNPLHIATTWAFLYEFYGLPKYGYLPFWGGHDQKGWLGNLPQKPFGEDVRYLIIEDLAGIDPFYLDKAILEEEKVSNLIEEKVFGKLRVQYRIFYPNKGAIHLQPLWQSG